MVAANGQANSAPPPPDKADAHARVEPQEALWEKPFLAKLEETGSVTLASKHVNRNRTYVYEWKAKRTPFRDRWNEIVNTLNDDLEASVFARSLAGWAEPVFYKGKAVGTIQRYDGNLSKWMLSKRKPGKYGDKPGEGRGATAPMAGEGQDADTVTAAEAIRRAAAAIEDATVVRPPLTDEQKKLLRDHGLGALVDAEERP